MSLDVGYSNSSMLPTTSSGQFLTAVMEPYKRTTVAPPLIFSNNSQKQDESGLPEHVNPKQEVHEQPNGQFQITENGALNLMKAESMDILVVNNLAQDLSVGKEQSITVERDEELPDTSLITGPLDDIYPNQQQQEQTEHHQESMELPVSNCFAADSVTMAIAESLPCGFLSSLVQSQGNNFPCIESLNSAVFAVPEVEVLTSNVSCLVDLPSSPGKVLESNQPLKDLATSICPMQMTDEQEENVSEDVDPTILELSKTNENTAPKHPNDVKLSLKSDVLHCLWKECGSSFVSGEELANHVNETHVTCERDEEYKCHWLNCPRKGKGFNARLLRMLLSPFPQKLRITHPNVFFFCRYKMLIHVRTHTNERPHVCNLCGKSFSRLENLKIHIRTHSGEKPYICPVPNCNKAYANSSDRFKHVRTHQEDKPFACKMPGCNKRYTDPSSLRKHVKNHGHRLDGNATAKKKSVASRARKSTLANNTIEEGTEQVQSTVVTLIPNEMVNQDSTGQLISLNMANSVSNRLHSSVRSSTGTNSNNACTKFCTNRENDNANEKCNPVVIKKQFEGSKPRCLVITTETGKSQDTPLDLSTCTAFQSSVSEENRQNYEKTFDVKLCSLNMSSYLIEPRDSSKS